MLNLRHRGVVEVALVGEDSFDVAQVDLESLSLYRADGIGGTVALFMGPSGPWISVDDVATPLHGGPCACHDQEGDGIDDLVLTFSTPNLAEVLELDSVELGSIVELVLYGYLLDGYPFEASDCVSPVGISVPLFPNPRYAVEDRPRAIAVGDLNGDGHVDLAVAKFNPDNYNHGSDISVLLNRGDGTYGEHVRYGTPQDYSAVAIGDLDGDGDADLAATSPRGISVLLNEGAGTFADELICETTFEPTSIAVGDLNLDGHIDLATSASVFLNDGSGASWYEHFYLGGGDTGVSLADVDSDGYLDLVSGESSRDTVAVLFNDGDGTYGNKVSYSVGDGPASVAVGDLDDDGDIDIVVANRNSDDVSVLLNQGDGTFGDDTVYGVGDAPSSLTVADLDGDGDIDIVVGNRFGDDVSVLFNQGSGTFATVGTYEAGRSPNSVALADADGDGDPDLFVALGSDEIVMMLVNKGNGVFTQPSTYAVGDGPQSVASGDLDGDGDLDLAVASGLGADISVLLNRGDGIFVADTAYGVGEHPRSIAAGDLDGDGDLDLCSANRMSDNFSVLLNRGDGTFAEKVDYESWPRPWSIAVGDLDGDGDLDVALAAWGADPPYDEKRVLISFNHGDGTFAIPVSYGVSSASYSLVIGDLDGDGDLDLAMGKIRNSVPLLMNNGDGTFVESSIDAFGGRAISPGDLDRDGDLDLVVGGSGGGYFAVMLNNGDATFSVTVAVEPRAGFSKMALADVDIDGDLDLVVTASAGIGVLLNDGGGAFGRFVAYATGESTSRLSVGDFDGDGDPDVAVAHANADKLSILLNRAIVDCNRTGVPDECDIDCGPPGGPCDVPGCGQSGDCNGNAYPDECDIADGVSMDDNGDGVPDDCVMLAALDIKPGSCPNPLNPRSQGVVPMALVGDASFDVADVDVDSLWLSRVDGVGGSVAPLMGPPGPGIRIDDVATPLMGEPCACHELDGDGIDDLTLKFSLPELVEALELDSVRTLSTVELILRGSLPDGGAFEARDCVSLSGRADRSGLRGRRGSKP